MPFNNELGMRTFDPLAAYESGQPAAEAAERGFVRGQSQADKARQLLQRNMAVEAMKIRAKELYAHMNQTPENENLAQRQAFLEYAPGVMGEEAGLGRVMGEMLRSDEANLVRSAASKELAKQRDKALDLQEQVETRKTAEGMLKAENAGIRSQLDLLKAELSIRDKAADRDLKERGFTLREKELGVREKNVDRLSARFPLSDADKAELKSIIARRDKLQALYDDASVADKADPDSKAYGQGLQIKLYESQIRGLKRKEEKGAVKPNGAKSPAPDAPPKTIPQDQLKVGEKYRLDDGRIGKYKGGDPGDESSYEFEPGGEG